MATDLYTVIQGLDVTQDEILQAELAAEKILSAKYPDLDMRQGTGLRDLVIRPSATLLALLDKATKYYFAQNTLPGVTDNSPTEIVDKILSNWFVERKAGKKSVVSARLFFATRKNVTVGTEIYFSTDNRKRFYPLTTYSFSPSDLEYDSFSGEYFVDIDLVADKEGPEYDLSSGSLLYFSNFDPYFLRGELNYLREMSSVTETNSQFIARSRTAISTRNLINVPSIDARIREDFDYIKHIVSIGKGDPEMYRDRVKVMAPQVEDPILLHLGGKIDVYLKTPLETQVIQYTSDDRGVVTVEGPVLSFTRSEFSAGDEEDSISMTRDVFPSHMNCVNNVVTVTALAHGYSYGEYVTVTGAVPAGYNGTYQISSVPDSNSFTYVVPQNSLLEESGNPKCSVPTVYTVSYPGKSTYTCSLTKVLNEVTFHRPNHEVMEGRYVVVTNATHPDLNGTFKVNSATKDSFTVENLSTLAPSHIPGIELTAADAQVTWTDALSDVGLSPWQKIEIDFGTVNAARTVSLNVTLFQGLEGIQGYLEDSSRRVLTAEPLARGMNLYMLDVHVTGYNGPVPSASQCGSIVNEYLDTLTPGEPFIMADLIAKLNAGGVGTIKTPVEVSYKFYNRDNTEVWEGVIEDVLDPNDRTSTFMLNDLTTSNEYI